MSYLNLPGGIENFSKATISFWFRVPADSFAAVSAAFDFNPDGEFYHVYPPFNGILPLLVFGDPTIEGYYPAADLVTFATISREARGFQFPGCEWVTLSTTAKAITDYQISEGPHYPLAPCYIGVQVDPYTNTGHLKINLQFPEPGVISGLYWYTIGVSANDEIGNVSTHAFPECDNGPVPYGPDGQGNSGWVVPDEFHVETWTKGDFTDVAVGGTPESFVVDLNEIEITPDQWHHVLLSFDLDGKIDATGLFNPGPGATGTLNSECKLWLAVDDVNYTNTDNAWGRAYSDVGAGENDFATDNALRAAHTGIGGDFTVGPYLIPAFDIGDFVSTSNYSGGGLPRFNWSAPPIASKANPLGIPAPEKYVDAVYPVEMAELQFFTRVTLDTGVEVNRRAFITADGRPADPLKPPIPIPPPPGPPPIKGPRELLGKEADILLHGSGNWIAGTNTGKVYTLNEIGQLVPQAAEKFDTTGLIAAYSPDPSLHGPQSPPPQPPVPLSTLRL